MYPTVAMANAVGMNLSAYWENVIKACHLDHPDPVAKRKEILRDVKKVKDHLDSLKIDSLHIQ